MTPDERLACLILGAIVLVCVVALEVIWVLW
jgi:hypothetical protein